ncbi:hypothetical protein AWW66_06025 [Micromonospora rosaria]|uniref:HTH iclR-type domain-containing protein n=1 Tax=Micromonospora rosaria TaxID=47874 RepID=A0A136PWX5_9ACTN|nr:hypothetical protein AWW66_06025 [Micromonospora rosaria]
MVRYSEGALLAQARTQLAALLPEDFELGEAVLDDQGPFDGPDAVWQLREQHAGYGLILVEAKQSLTPRDVSRLRERLSGPVMRLMRGPTVLVVAPWLSPRTRALLEEAGHSYLDLTGNVRFRIDRPAVYLRLQGADRDPNPKPQSQARLQGPKARRLVRLLVEATPPYRSKSLAEAAGLTPGYVSKVLSSLDEQALVERNQRGLVEHVDWPALLLSSAGSYDMLRNNQASTFIAQEGARALYARILADIRRPDVVLTGSFAASSIAQVAAPAQLVLYVADPELMRRFGRLLPTDRGADVVLLKPEDTAQVEGTRTTDDGLRQVGLGQLVLDCLGGNGRLPEEGQAVLDWMRAHEDEWRRPDLPRLDR